MAQIFEGEKQVLDYRFLVACSGLKLWIKTGMQPTRGVSILKFCKETYDLKGNKFQVLAQMEAIKAALLAPREIPDDTLPMDIL